MPRHTGQVWVFGGAPNAGTHPQKILVRVWSWACTSRPITASKRTETEVAGTERL